MEQLLGHKERWIAPLVGYPAAPLLGRNLKELLTDPKLHAQGILQLFQTFSPDIVFTLMDLSIEAQALGAQVSLPLNDSPTVKTHPVKDLQDVELLPLQGFFQRDRIKGYIEATSLLRNQVDVPLAAYVVGPFTLAGLLMGASQIAMATIEQPELVVTLVSTVTELLAQYARRLQDAGADLIVLLEPTATFLSPRSFQEFSGAWISRLLKVAQIKTLVLHICGDTTRLLPAMEATGCHGLSLDAPVDFPKASEVLQPQTWLIGNVNPVLFETANPQQIERTTRELAQKMQHRKNFVLSTGCDLPLRAKPENIEAFFRGGLPG